MDNIGHPGENVIRGNGENRRPRRYRPGTAAVRDYVPFEIIPRVISSEVQNPIRSGIIGRAIYSARSQRVSNEEHEDQDEVMDPVMEVKLREALVKAKDESDGSIAALDNLLFEVVIRPDLKISPRAMASFLLDLQGVNSIIFWTKGNASKLIKFFEKMFRRVRGLQAAWNRILHQNISRMHLEERKIKFLARLYAILLKNGTLTPLRSLWVSDGDWSPSLTLFFGHFFEYGRKMYSPALVPRKMIDSGVLDLLISGSAFIKNIGSAFKGNAGQHIKTWIMGLCRKRVGDMIVELLNDNTSFNETLVTAQAFNCGISNQELIAMIWSAITKKVLASSCKENQRKVLANIPRILVEREQLRNLIQVNNLTFFKAMSLPAKGSHLMEEMNIFIASCLHFGIIKRSDILAWKKRSQGSHFNKDNACHEMLRDFDIEGI